MKNKRTPLEIFMKTTFFALFTMLLCSLGAAEPAPYADMIYKMDKFKPENWDPEL